MKRSILSFSSKLSSGFSRPLKKFIDCMIYGILASNSVLISEISRNLHEDISLKKTHERLSRNLQSFNQRKTLLKNYSNITRKYICFDTPIIDTSDISKKYTVASENLGKVRDGSTGQTNVDGYFLVEALFVNHNDKLPVPLYSKLFSQTEPSFISENEEVLECIRNLKSFYGSNGIYTMDRGMDNILFFNELNKSKLSFAIRLKKNRNLIVNDKVINIVELVKKYKGKYSVIIKKKNGKSRKIQYGLIPVQLPELPGQIFNLVFVRGYSRSTLMILTNMSITNGKECLKPILSYIARWNVEEFIRFKKNQFKLEDIRVQTYNRLINMNLLLTMAIGYIALLSKSYDNSQIVFILKDLSKRIHKIPPLPYYSLADGIYVTLNKTKTGIIGFLPLSKKLPKSHQLSLFNLSYISTYMVS